MSLNVMDVTEASYDFIAIFMFLFDGVTQQSFHMLVKGDGMKILDPTPPSMARV